MLRRVPHALLPNHYTWLVLVSAMDIMMTWIVLIRGGREYNALAAGIIERWGLPGIVTFKFAIIIFVIGLCEIIGRRAPRAARMLATSAILLTAFPVMLAFFLLLVHLRH